MTGLTKFFRSKARGMADAVAPKEKGGRLNSNRPMEHPEMLTDTIPFIDVKNNNGNTPFPKKLRWHIENPPKDAVCWTITPAMAAEMLKWNDRNRPITRSKVVLYSEKMIEGWKYTGVPIIFSSLRLIDGQHRLLASVETSKSFEAIVVFGVPDEAFAYIDTGKPRSASDIFAIHGVKNWALMAASIEWVVGYEAGTLVRAASGKNGLDHAAKYDAYKVREELQDSAWVGQLFGPRKLASPSMMTAFHYLCAKKSRRAADEFFRKVAEGIGFAERKDPAYRLHKKLVDNAISQEKLGRLAIAAITVKAWNASRLNRDSGALTFGFDEAFPKVI